VLFRSDYHQVEARLAELEANERPNVTRYLYMNTATTHHNGNFKIVLPDQSTDSDIDIVMDIIQKAFENL